MHPAVAAEAKAKWHDLVCTVIDENAITDMQISNRNSEIVAGECLHKMWLMLMLLC
jgi:hypothetical protein